ncbi:MAG TPA: ABC transporter substrate-binding protein [Pseudonocardiaceae bacterium]|jgi:alpha-glucoside transport system substrate-binding protein|nr:ABC transporter substrate-binding protein [Pseudonocardiaceae bacterium]
MNVRRSLARLAPVAVLALAIAGLPACASSAGDDTITLMSLWGGALQTWLVDHVLADFTKQTGIQVRYQLDTRAIDQDLESELQTGTQPDIAVLPSPGDLEAFAEQGALYPLDSALADQTGRYGQQWLSLETAVQPADGGAHKYALPIASGLKSLVWYDPNQLRQLLGPTWNGALPTTWDQLTALTNAISAHGGIPWCMGMASTSTSGWPGTDWIEDILLHQSGPRVYEQWADGISSWQRTPQIAGALATFGSIVANGKNVDGGLDGALLTTFDQADTPMFPPPKNQKKPTDSPPSPPCYLEHAASIGDLDTSLVPGTDYDYFPFPTINSQYANTYEVSGDFVAMFRQSPQAEKLIHYLAQDSTQKEWVQADVQGLLSPDRDVTPSDYPNPVTRRTEQLVSKASVLCFDGSDLMPPGVTTAFYQAVLTYLSDPQRYQDPTRSATLLGELDNSRAAADSAPLTYQCGQ